MAEFLGAREPLTEAAFRFYKDYLEVTDFLGFVAQLATDFDDSRDRLIRRHVHAASDPAERLRFEEMLENAGRSAVGRLATYEDLFLEMLFSRGVDNFLTYVADVLALILGTRPEMLRSKEEVRLEEVLAHDTMEDLVAFLVDRRVERLAFRGLRELGDDVSQKYALALFADEAELARAADAVEIRNLIVHNRAVINRRFLSRVSNLMGQLGQRVHLTVDMTFGELDFLGTAVGRIDGEAREKFGIQARRTFDELHEELTLGRGNVMATRRAETPRSPSGDVGHESAT
jgi:hypothetical protein